MKVYGIDDESRLFYKGEALLRPGYPFFVPHLEAAWCAIPSLAIKIGRTGKCVAPPFAERYIESCAAGWDITCRSLLAELREARAPWERAKVYDGSAVALDWQPLDTKLAEHYTLTLSEQSWTLSHTEVYQALSLLSECLTIHTGDVLLLNASPITAAPAIAPEQQLSLTLQAGEKLRSTTLLRIK